PDRREAVRAIHATGAIRAEQIARIRPEVGGEVLQVSVQQGGEVRQGDPVLQIKVRDEDLAVREQSAHLAEVSMIHRDARKRYDSAVSMLQQQLTTQQDVDNARASYDRAAASLRTVQASLAARRAMTGRGRMSSPITGVVTKVNVSVGDIVAPNTEAVTILDPASFKVYAEIDELDITNVQPGQMALVAFDAMPGKRFRARVERVIPQADEVTKTLPVVLNLIDYVANLSDGLTATINIIQERRPNALTVPASALVDEEAQRATLFVVSDQGFLQLRTVKLGVRGEEYVEIADGLREDERVALNPQEDWESGQEVVIDKARTRQQK
ncbi:MAG: efflux RND transporter periplasmic adaptor subunit, partial [bacterium]|nr:efflux RND transporter periplasmic adaptor subunit [Candidatus Kapabacteria bacterium]